MRAEHQWCAKHLCGYGKRVRLGVPAEGVNVAFSLSWIQLAYFSDAAS